MDFRSLGVREFGRSTRGCSESELSVAETDLTYDETGKEKGVYRPVRKGEAPKVTKSRIYLHDKSGRAEIDRNVLHEGVRRRTPANHALEPPCASTSSGWTSWTMTTRPSASSTSAWPISHGQRHFLVAAVDHIEQGFTQYLSRRPLSGVRAELAKLRARRRMRSVRSPNRSKSKTRNCCAGSSPAVHLGVDLNPVAVTLARVSIWIHTFVPGLPLSLLDHNLTCGNSLVGIGRVDEIRELAEAQKASARCSCKL